MSSVHPLVSCVAVLAAANVLNNRVARRWAPVTSAAATGALLIIARREGHAWPDLGFRRARRGALAGGALAAGVAAVYTAGVAWPRTRPLFHDERALALSPARLLEEALVQVPFGTVLLEEVGFRGVLPALLGRVFPARTAVAASAVSFGLWHVLPAVDMARANPALSRLASGESPVPGSVPDAPPSGTASVAAVPAGGGGGTARLVAGTVVSTALAGVVFHELRRRGGLLAPSLLHLSTNSFGYAAAWAARRIGDGRHPYARGRAAGQESADGSAMP